MRTESQYRIEKEIFTMFTLAEILQIAAGLIIWTVLSHINSKPAKENDPDINTYIYNSFAN